MKLRPVIAIVTAGLVWWLFFPAVIISIAFLWPGLREAVRAYQESGEFTVFTDTSMLVTFQLLWLVTNALTGLVAALIAKRQLEVWVVTGLLVAFFAFNHWWAFWVDFPVWYNVLVVLLVAPMVLLGGRVPRLIAATPSNG